MRNRLFQQCPGSERKQPSPQSRVSSVINFDMEYQTVTQCVITGQILFMGYGYLDALLCGELTWEKAHISAVLDHDRRALLCTIMAMFCLYFMYDLEEKRVAVPFSAYRKSLATCCGLGIVLTCIVRESACFALHAGGACLAFGAAVVLVMLIATNQPEENRTKSIRTASLLMVVCGITGSLQFAKIGGLFHFPSWALATGECIIVVGYGIAISIL